MIRLILDSLLRVFITLTVIWAFLSSCAHVCVEPEVRAANQGIVLECRDAPNDYVTCTVNTQQGDREFAYKACP